MKQAYTLTAVFAIVISGSLSAGAQSTTTTTQVQEPKPGSSGAFTLHGCNQVIEASESPTGYFGSSAVMRPSASRCGPKRVSLDLSLSCPSAVPLQDGKPRRNSQPVQRGFWSRRKPSGSTNMNDFLRFFDQLLDKIPATFWGVVVGSLVTLSGIFFTNRANDDRLSLQLQNDRELKNREREMTFRKDTYAAAAEAIAVSMSALSKFSELSFSLKEVSATYLEKSPVLAKVNLVAGEDTIRALANFGAEFAGAFFRLTQQRMVLSILQEQIAVKVALVKGFEKTRDAMIELLRHHNIEGTQDVRRFEAIEKNFEFEAGRIAMTNQKIQQMTAEFFAKHVPFAKQCFVETKNVNRLLIPLLVAARMELELSISKEKYAEILHQAYSNLEGHLDEFIQNIAAVNAVAPTS
jgi:hypothetical protein